MVIEGHVSVEAALEAGIRHVHRVWATRPGDRRLGRLRALARERGVLIDAVEPVAHRGAGQRANARRRGRARRPAARPRRGRPAGRGGGGVAGRHARRHRGPVQLRPGGARAVRGGHRRPRRAAQRGRRRWRPSRAASAGATELLADGRDRLGRRGGRPICAPLRAAGRVCGRDEPTRSSCTPSDLTRRALHAHRRRTARRDALIRRGGRPAPADRLRARPRAGPGRRPRRRPSSASRRCDSAVAVEP